MSDARLKVREKGFWNECSEGGAQLCDARDGVALLPFVVPKLRGAGLRVSRDGSPEFIAAKVPMAGKGMG